MKLYKGVMILITGMLLAAACKKTQVIDIRNYSKAVVDSISPGVGPAGSYFYVYGQNFAYNKDDVQANLNGKALEVIEVSANKLFLKTPADAVSGTLNLWFNRIDPNNTAYNYGGLVDSVITGPEFRVDNAHVPVPIIQSLSKTTITAGDSLIIYGYNFAASGADVKVMFGSEAMEPVDVSINRIKVISPVSGNYGSMKVLVAQAGNQSNEVNLTINEPLTAVVYYSVDGGLVKKLEAGSTSTLYNTGGNLAYGIDVDKESGYFYALVAGTNELVRGKLDGTGQIEQLYGSGDGFSYVIDVAIDPPNNTILITDAFANKIWKGAMDGSQPLTELYDVSGGGFINGIKIAGNEIFWTELGSGNDNCIKKGTLSGETPTVLFSGAADGAPGPTCVAIDQEENRLFVYDYITNSINVGNLDGTGTLAPFFINTGNINDVEFDPVRKELYWTGDKDLMRGKTDGSAIETIYTESNSLFFLKVVYE